MSFELTGVKKSFPRPGGGDHLVLDLASFAAKDGEQLCLAGGSGSGKTTVLNVIAGITVPDSGRVVVKGTDVARLRESARDRFRARHVGYMFQVFNLLQGYSALENVVLPLHFAGEGSHASRERAAALLGRVGLGAKTRHKPGALSVGEQQRV